MRLKVDRVFARWVAVEHSVRSKSLLELGGCHGEARRGPNLDRKGRMGATEITYDA